MEDDIIATPEFFYDILPSGFLKSSYFSGIENLRSLHVESSLNVFVKVCFWVDSLLMTTRVAL